MKLKPGDIFYHPNNRDVLLCVNGDVSFNVLNTTYSSLPEPRSYSMSIDMVKNWVKEHGHECVVVINMREIHDLVLKRE